MTREIFASREHVFTARKIQYIKLYNWGPDKFWRKKKRKKILNLNSMLNNERAKMFFERQAISILLDRKSRYFENVNRRLIRFEYGVTVNQKDSRRIQVVRRVGSKVPRELFYFETRQVLIVHRAITRRNVRERIYIYICIYSPRIRLR